MYIKDNTLRISLFGDWSKFYTQADWISQHVYESEEIEMRVQINKNNPYMEYRNNGVIIAPKQDEIYFVIEGISDEILDHLARYLNNFINKVPFPLFTAYNIAMTIVEENTYSFASFLDSIDDASSITDSNYVIEATQIVRKLKKDDRTIIMASTLDEGKLEVSFIQVSENNDPETYRPSISLAQIKEFIEECTKIMNKLGYEMDGDL